MKRTIFLYLFIATVLTSCNSTEQKTDSVKTTTTPTDSLKVFLQVKKMEVKAFSMIQPGYYDSAMARYNVCLNYLNKVLADNNNKGVYLYAADYTEIYQGIETIYDSIKQPENSIKSAQECLKWARTTHDNQQQIKLDMHIADKYRIATTNTKNDTAKKGNFGRQGLLYAAAATKLIDSLNIHDMDDSKYEDFHLTSNIYTLLGDQKQAHEYDKKYRDLYYSIFKKQPE